MQLSRLLDKIRELEGVDLLPREYTMLAASAWIS